MYRSLKLPLPTTQELVCRERPLRGHLRAPRVPDECPASVSALVDACIEAEAPALRPSAYEVFQRLKARCGKHCRVCLRTRVMRGFLSPSLHVSMATAWAA